MDGFSSISKYAKLSSLCQEGCLGPKLSFQPLGGAKKSHVWCEGLNSGMTSLAECLALLLMFFKHIWALLGLSPSKGIFCHYTNTGGGYKPYPST